jgi:shikimate 5-dehydrogenase
VGSGGAAAAAVVACRDLGFRVIGVTSRSWTGSEATFESKTGEHMRGLGALTSPWPLSQPSHPPGGKSSQMLRLQWLELARGADLVIQATSAGMQGGDPGDVVTSIVPWDGLGPRTVAYDVVYGRVDTPFLAAARARGLRAVGGVGMLVRQAAASLSLWLGVEPPVVVMRAAADAELGARP